MNIAICDDEKNVRSYMRKLIEKQEKEIHITEYASGKELLAQLSRMDGQQLDLLFLDIALRDMDGMSIAENIRKLQEREGQAAWGSLPLIIFVTGYSEYMPAAFSVHAFQFVRKPIDEGHFEMVFRQAVRELRHIKAQRGAPEKKITVGRRKTIRAGDILYIESSGHKNIIRLQNVCIEHYGKISDLERELSPEFFRIHRGYLVNLSCVDHYDRTNVYMDNGDSLCLSRYKYNEFVKAYLQHMSEEQ